MRRRAAFFLIAAALAASSTRAEIDPAALPPSNSAGLELIILEAEGCIYCGLFRRNVLPLFEASDQEPRISIRFLDINDLETAGLALQSAVDIVPTFVVVRNGEEIGRIPGYVGAETFNRSISYLISSAR